MQAFCGIRILLAFATAVLIGGAQDVQPGRTIKVEATGGEAAIHAALAALPTGGGRVHLGAGTFVLTRPIVLDRDNVELRGQGAETKLVLGPRPIVR